MPRFYFHLHNGLDVVDEEGKDFLSLDAARTYAMCAARDEAAHHVKEGGHLVLHHRIDIEDEHGGVLSTVHFGDVVKFSD